MKLVFDCRVLTHKVYSGVENYTKNILDNTKKKVNTSIAKPKTTNKYFAHLWTHFILPFQKGNILFCPANIAPIYVPKSKKLVVSIHDVAFVTQPKSFSNIFRIYYQVVMPFIINRADKIITVSQYSKDEIEKYYPKSKGKIKVIYNGYDKKYKSDLSKFNKEKQILYVGSINERKNFKNLIKAFYLLELKNTKLILIGNFFTNFRLDSETLDILTEAQKNPNIIFKSNVTNHELINIYTSSKLFVFPSLYEGFGLPVLEAMACGIPVVCSNLTSMPEVGGDAVIYCDPYNVEDIKEKIIKVLEDENLQMDMIIKGLERAKMFSWDKSGQEHIEVFKEILA